MRLVTTTLAAAILIGCGMNEPRGHVDAQPERRPAPPSSSDPDNRPVIVAFGDSLSAGHGVEPDESYPAFLQKLLDEAGIRYRVVNAGVSGDTTSAGLARLGGVTALNPAVVILELGGNDGLRGLPIETTRANLEEMIVTLRETGAMVVLAGMTLPPNYGADYITAFERVYRDLAAKHALPLIPFLLEGVALNPKLMQSDGIHPTAAGNARVAENVMETLAPLLENK